MSAEHTEVGGQATLKVQVKLMGDLAAVIGQRNLEVDLPGQSTVGDLMAALSRTYGEAFTARVFASPTKLHHYILIFVDGEHLQGRETLAAPLGKGEVDLVMLPMFGGG